MTKASSGNMKVNMEKIEINSLLRQTFGELEDKINDSHIIFVKKFNPNKLMIYADGKKLFRVFQNLISNILKYSMNNTRAYINILEDKEKVIIEFKNISKDIISLSEEELLERFKRGDSSRSTEGNGLGLAISKELTLLQKGEFEIKIDGDLFKVTLKFNKVS